jgi:CDP-glucose 4,6-dehydratase
MVVSLQESLRKTFSKKRVFITGATGFKGAWLAEWFLLLGAEVTGFSLPQAVSTPCLFDQLGLTDRITDLRGDIRDAKSIRQAIHDSEPDFVFHLAAQPLVRLSYQEPVPTWETNVLGTIHVMEALRLLATPCVTILITTDKVYENREWNYGYREEDPLGGHDPYSSSKAAAEIAIASWRRSFFGPKHPVKIASARAGNVIGGGDWALDRIVPDCIRAIRAGKPVPVRNKTSTRPWQHVLEPLSGYLTLAAALTREFPHRNEGDEVDENKEPRTKNQEQGTHIEELSSAFNFGPALSSNRTVADLVQEILLHWPGHWEDRSDPRAPHEAGKLNLATDKAFHLLAWQPRWDFPTTIQKTVEWYRHVHEGADPHEITMQQIQEYSLG